VTVTMKGSEVAAAMKEELLKEVEQLAGKGIVPGLGIVRVGARPDDLAYERGATKKLEGMNMRCQVFEFPETISQSDFEREFAAINAREDVHGILLFRPLPKHLDEEAAKRIINPLKDIDCMGAPNIAKVFSGDETGYAPCTAEAVMHVLRHYDIDVQGRRVTVVGRSMVVGKPLTMLLIKKNATVTVCHTRTKDLPGTCRGAEILVAAAGKAKMVTADFVTEGTAVIDVGINVDAEGKLCGDVDFEAVAPLASHITPVPGGVGAVTSSVLAQHVVRAAKYLNGIAG